MTYDEQGRQVTAADVAGLLGYLADGWRGDVTFDGGPPCVSRTWVDPDRATVRGEIEGQVGRVAWYAEIRLGERNDTVPPHER